MIEVIPSVSPIASPKRYIITKLKKSSKKAATNATGLKSFFIKYLI
jgi:hypothetical protein